MNKKIEEGKTNVLCVLHGCLQYEYQKKINFTKATAKQRQISFSFIKAMIITKDSKPLQILQFHLCPEELKNVLCGYHLALIRPYKNNLSGIFLSYLFSLERPTSLLPTRKQFDSIWLTEVITDTPLPIPPLTEQKKIHLFSLLLMKN